MREEKKGWANELGKIRSAIGQNWLRYYVNVFYRT